MNAKADSSVVSDQEVVCNWMERKTTELPGQTKPKALLGSPWWDWSIGHGPFPQPLTLDLLRQVEERLTREQRAEYWRVFAQGTFNEHEEDNIWWELVHASVEQKTKTLAVVIRTATKPHRTDPNEGGE